MAAAKCTSTVNKDTIGAQAGALPEAQRFKCRGIEELTSRPTAAAPLAAGQKPWRRANSPLPEPFHLSIPGAEPPSGGRAGVARAASGFAAGKTLAQAESTSAEPIKYRRWSRLWAAGPETKDIRKDDPFVLEHRNTIDAAIFKSGVTLGNLNILD